MENKLNKKLIRQIKRSAKKGDGISKQACIIALQALKGRMEAKEVNKLIVKYSLDTKFGVQFEPEESEKMAKLSPATVKLKKGAELINKSTGNSTKIEKDITLEQMFEKFSKKPVDPKKVKLEETEKGNLRITIGETVYMVRKKEFEIVEAKAEADEEMEIVEPKKSKKKDKDEEEDDDEEDEGDDEEDEGDEDEGEDEGEDEDEGDEDEEDEEPKSKKKAKKDKDEDDEDDEKEDEDDEDEEEEKPSKKSKKSKKDDDEDEGGKDDEDEGEGKDMNQLAETIGEDVDKWPDRKSAKTAEDKFKAKIKIQILRGRKLQGKIDKINERFGRMFKRYFRKELRKRYGKNWREQNYGEVFESFLNL